MAMINQVRIGPVSDDKIFEEIAKLCTAVPCPLEEVIAYLESWPGSRICCEESFHGVVLEVVRLETMSEFPSQYTSFDAPNNEVVA